MGDPGDGGTAREPADEEADGAFEFGDVGSDDSKADESASQDSADAGNDDGPELSNPDDDGSTDGKEQASPNAMAGAADFTEDDDPAEDDDVGEDPLTTDHGGERAGEGGSERGGDCGAGPEFDAVGFSQDDDVDFGGSGSDQSGPAGQSPPPEEEAAGEGDSDNGGSGEFYDIDPVSESEKAFNFAEKQSKAAYEFAYEGATQNPMTKLLRKYTSEEVRKRLDQVFSRKMLGSVLIGMSFTNIIVVSIDAATGRPGIFWWEPFLWVGIFVLSVFIFVWWERLARTATEAANTAAESASEAAESASKKAEAATKKAEAASEAASQAAETATGRDGDEGTTSKPTTLDGKGQTAGSDAGDEVGERRPPPRRRAPDRRPNKRFEQEPTTQQRLSTYENGEEFEHVDSKELPPQGSGFENAGRADRSSATQQPHAPDR